MSQGSQRPNRTALPSNNLTHIFWRNTDLDQRGSVPIDLSDVNRVGTVHLSLNDHLHCVTHV
jgi:hypothetical protein